MFRLSTLMDAQSLLLGLADNAAGHVRRLNGHQWAPGADTQPYCFKESDRHNEKTPPLAGLSPMELAGLEPATS